MRCHFSNNMSSKGDGRRVVNRPHFVKVIRFHLLFPLENIFIRRIGHIVTYSTINTQHESMPYLGIGYTLFIPGILTPLLFLSCL